jgi:hypothetical protein
MDLAERFRAGFILRFYHQGQHGESGGQSRQKKKDSDDGFHEK